MSALHDLHSHAAAAPDRIAIVCGDERLGRGELEALAIRLAALLRSVGRQPGDHLASLIGNRPERWRWPGRHGAPVCI
jgi:fatty-acyl-CoA synthase